MHTKAGRINALSRLKSCEQPKLLLLFRPRRSPAHGDGAGGPVPLQWVQKAGTQGGRRHLARQQSQRSHATWANPAPSHGGHGPAGMGTRCPVCRGHCTAENPAAIDLQLVLAIAVVTKPHCFHVAARDKTSVSVVCFPHSPSAISKQKAQVIYLTSNFNPHKTCCSVSYRYY